MIYFFHHYELPVIIQQAQVQQILRLRTRQRHQQQNGAHGATNSNASNIRNGPNATNQANNDAMGNNQMNNNVNNANNNNHRIGNFFPMISFMLSFQMASIIFNYAVNLIGMLQGRLTNDVLGTAAFFNNNNDNSLNNNNNNPTANITRLRINLSRLRRINLAGIQINPIQINPADGTENIRIDRDETASDESVTENSALTTMMTMTTTTMTMTTTTATSTMETSTSTINENNHTATHESNHCDGNDFQDELSNHTKMNEQLGHSFESLIADDFDIIDANDGIEVNNELIDDHSVFVRSNDQVSQIIDNFIDKNGFYSKDQPKEGTSHDYDIQIQSIDSSSSTDNKNIEPCTIARSDLTNDTRNMANSISQTNNDEQQFQWTNAHRAEVLGLNKSKQDNPYEGLCWKQGDRRDISLANTNADIGICTELGESSTFSSHATDVAPNTIESTAIITSQTNVDINTPNIPTTSNDSNAADGNILTTITNNNNSNTEK